MADLSPKNIRTKILQMAYRGQTAHVACAFSVVEILTTLYSDVLTRDDEFILSKGHGVMALYAILAELGHIEPKELETYFQDGTRLRGLAEAGIPGIYTSTGSLGQGFPVAVGMALGKKLNKEPGKVYCLVGDGEMNAGPIWESLQFASHHKLSNLTLIVDQNGFQAMGPTHDILDQGILADKLSAFGWTALRADGHNVSVLKERLQRKNSALPVAIIADTVKGKGVSFMENENEFHYRRLNAETFQAAIEEVHA